MKEIEELKLGAKSKWSWYEKEFFEPGELTEKKRLAIVAAMMDFAIKEVTNNIIETLMEIEKKDDG